MPPGGMRLAPGDASDCYASSKAGPTRGLETKLLRWMFGFWVSTLIGLGALFFR